MKADADVAEERDRVTRRECTQHATDDRRASAPEVGGRDARVCDVAARSAADEDFGAGLLRALEEQDRSVWVGAAREDGGREAGGAGADDDDVSDALCYAPCEASASR